MNSASWLLSAVPHPISSLLGLIISGADRILDTTDFILDYSHFPFYTSSKLGLSLALQRNILVSDNIQRIFYDSEMYRNGGLNIALKACNSSPEAVFEAELQRFEGRFISQLPIDDGLSSDVATSPCAILLVKLVE